MFGCIVAGRLIQTDVKQVDSNKYVFELPQAQDINHIVVFMTGTMPFPDGYAATVHFYWPQPIPDWRLLGMLSNDKPSAIFKLANAKSIPSDSPFGGPMMGGVSAELGISIEPIDQVIAQIQSSEAVIASSKASTMANAEKITTKIIENLYNYCSSFSSSLLTNERGEQFFPLKVIQDWHNNTLRKVKTNPNYFLKD
ncbi:hypothetical protein BCR36DRAFT_582485 [Piromyces finnis]|uniref:Uncharacterized protein n=1 Tax=Piromyces finnis TaxID=1754191 RepID=A0A1Y1VCE9_9FUNG|nr:hypothetical protein BCR36DRAFT_582485 [Piromyces finnis]|eukprot:ORX52537.1 hypothetical protein BCR36DRAFT_582485 [Piromyces finnis]